MSEPIKVGDLVQVVRGHECDLGEVGTVLRIETYPQGWHCDKCGHRQIGAYTAAICSLPHSGYPLSWLKRIPPISELDDVRQDEEITA